MAKRPNDAIDMLVDYGKAADDLVAWINELEATGAELVRMIDDVSRADRAAPESARVVVAMVALLDYTDKARALFCVGSDTEKPAPMESVAIREGHMPKRPG